MSSNKILEYPVVWISWLQLDGTFSLVRICDLFCEAVEITNFIQGTFIF